MLGIELHQGLALGLAVGLILFLNALHLRLNHGHAPLSALGLNKQRGQDETDDDCQDDDGQPQILDRKDRIEKHQAVEERPPQ